MKRSFEGEDLGEIKLDYVFGELVFDVLKSKKDIIS